VTEDSATSSLMASKKNNATSNSLISTNTLITTLQEMVSRGIPNLMNLLPIRRSDQPYHGDFVHDDEVCDMRKFPLFVFSRYDYKASRFSSKQSWHQVIFLDEILHAQIGAPCCVT
jgi:hypothetical protein